MNLEQWIIRFLLLGGLVFGFGTFAFSVRRMYLVIPAVLLFLTFVYEIRMDRWEKTVSAPIRLDMFVEIPLMASRPTLCQKFEFQRRSRLHCLQQPSVS